MVSGMNSPLWNRSDQRVFAYPSNLHAAITPLGTSGTQKIGIQSLLRNTISLSPSRMHLHLLALCKPANREFGGQFQLSFLFVLPQKCEHLHQFGCYHTATVGLKKIEIAFVVLGVSVCIMTSNSERVPMPGTKVSIQQPKSSGENARL